MKVIVGVDSDGLYRGALNLLGRLKFPDAEVELIHTAEPIPPYPDAGFIATSEIDEAIEATAQTLLAQAEEYAHSSGLKTTRHEYVVGPVTACLMDAADSAHADLIAIGSHQKSRYGAFFLGSVGRGLTISSSESILISKGEVAADGPITAIFATDYSDYAQEALRQFIGMKPAGLTKLVLVTAVAAEAVPDPTVLRIVESEDTERQFFLEAGKKAIGELAASGISAEAHVLAGDVHHCIEQNMRELGADLLVMGAHGHGFFERLMLGSTSLREALATHHPILIVRNP